MTDNVQFVTELFALMAVLIIVVRELRLARKEMNGVEENQQ